MITKFKTGVAAAALTLATSAMAGNDEISSELMTTPFITKLSKMASTGEINRQNRILRSLCLEFNDEIAPVLNGDFLFSRKNYEAVFQTDETPNSLVAYAYSQAQTDKECSIQVNGEEIAEIHVGHIWLSQSKRGEEIGLEDIEGGFVLDLLNSIDPEQRQILAREVYKQVETQVEQKSTKEVLTQPPKFDP